jgi:hypothetical protein
MGYKKQLKTNEFAPGPGAYNPSVMMSKENLGSIKIGTSLRDSKGMMGGQDNPGPGNYNSSTALGGPNFAFGTGGRNGSKKDTTPGPGHYKVPYHISQLPRYAMPDKAEEFRYV